MKSNRHSEYRAKWKAFDKSSSFPFELNPVAEKCHFEEDSKLIFVLIIFDSLKVSFLLVSCFSLATSSSKFNFSFNKSKTLSAKPACVAFLLQGCSPVHSFRHNTKCFWKRNFIFYLQLGIGRCLNEVVLPWLGNIRRQKDKTCRVQVQCGT